MIIIENECKHCLQKIKNIRNVMEVKLEVKVLSNYDMSRVISRARKEFGFIERGTEELYNPQLDYLEHEIYNIYEEIEISDRELKEVIEMIIYDLKGIIENKVYDYTDIRNDSQIEFSKRLQMLFNPILNEEINIKDEYKKDFKEIFTFPIKCLLRIYDSIEFWNKHSGRNGYYHMLEDMVLPVVRIGNHPFALEDEYLNLEN